MFYSQFILAKKGPLGTIWIAAHLERKLRKNQVADTDIGVSVDSILFPDAPIALRLSSHLLLGVVRIYSKKVNYLFNDCSEALIKIKHAFRSTAVDLPPEESTAPYHSITLPENFDLDNFELPDSACLDSNFVDHHVSTREQITLQDTLNDTAFPTSKFGLDERFGDEDASHLGLELDEDLFMDKKISPQHDEVSMSFKVSGSHHGETSVPSTSMGMDVQFGYEEEKCIEIPNELSELLSNNYDKNCFPNVEDLKRDVNSSHRHGYTIQTPDLNEVFQPESRTDLSQHIPFTPDVQTQCVVEPAQEPSTPGLLEAVPSNFQEVPALSPQEKAETYVESGRPGSCSGSYMDVECAEAGNKTVLISAELSHKSGETAQEFPPTSALVGPMSESLAPTYSNWNLTTDDVCLVSRAEHQQCGLTDNGVSNVSTADRRLDNEDAINPSGFSHEAINLTSPPELAVSFEEEHVTSNICTDNMDVSGGISDVKRTQKTDSNEPSKIASLGRVEDGDSCASTSIVGSEFLSKSCSSNLLPIFLNGDPSIFSHETINLTSPSKLVARFESEPANSNINTRFEAEPVNSNIGIDYMDVSGGISDVKRTQKKDSNEPSQIGNRVGVEDDYSCISTSVVGSGFLSKSYGSNLGPNLDPNLLDGDPSGFSHEAINLTPPPKLATRFEAEPITSNICSANMDVPGSISDVKSAQKKNSFEPSQFANLSRVEVGVEDGYSCISTSVVGSDFLSKSCGSNLHPILLHGDPSGFSQEAINLTSLPKLAARFEAEPVTSNICTDNMDVSGGISDVKRTQKKDNNEPSQIANLSRVERGDSCVSTSVVGSDFLSRSCGSNLHQSNSLFVDGALGEASELSLRDHSRSLKTPMREEMLHTFRSSFEVQGEDLRYSNDRVVSLEGQHMSRCTTSDIKYGASKRDEVSMGVFSHLDRINFSSSSEFLGTEKMLAPNFVVDLPNYQGLQAADKGVMESDGSVDRTSSRKRRVMDSTTILETGSSAKLAGIPRSRRSYVPDDDDVLASILGRTAPSLKTDSIPSLSKAPSQKRPRTMSRQGMPKRKKVLVDDAMVLHADAIRQQLINTEDIRRMRKKAPCSRPDIWKIYTCAMEDEIFDHSILTGIAVELNSLYDLKYGIQKDPSSHAKEYSSQIKTSGETGSSRVSEFLNGMGDKEMDERISSVPVIVDRYEGPTSITASDTVQTNEGGAQCDLHDQLEELPVQPQVEPSSNDQMSVICAMQPDAQRGVNSIIQETNEGISSVPVIVDRDEGPTIITASDTVQTNEGGAQCDLHDQLEELPVQSQVEPFSNDQVSVICAMQPDAQRGVNSIIQETPIPEINESISSLENFTDQNINLAERSPQNGAHNPLNTQNDVSACDERAATLVGIDGDTAVVAVTSESLIQTENVCNAVGTINNEEEKTGNVMDAEHSKSSHTWLANDGDTGGAVVNTQGHVLADGGAELLLEETNGSAVVVDTDRAVEALGDGERPVTDVTCAELHNVGGVPSSMEHVPSTVGENNCIQDINLEGGLDVDSMPVDDGAARDANDFCSAIDDNYTGFLNEDDDAEFNETENEEPNPENAQSMENSGWSARTRGVARYLKNLFDEESGQGRKSIVVNRLLAGKTRKEASRMFFETLVLKTRDYIQVEQEKPFEYINIKPRIKLLKSEF